MGEQHTMSDPHPNTVDGGRMPSETINGTTLAYDTAGEGHALVLVHGSWMVRQTWLLVLPGLTPSFRVVSYDRRGHGESDAQPEAGTIHDDVADIAALIEALDIAPAHVVANSYGACIALRLGVEHPDIVARMVCHEPPLLGVLEGSPDGKRVAEEVWRKFGEVRQRLERGDDADGAQYFVERVALGPGMWAQLPPEMQNIAVRNAPTFLGELRDSDAFRVDLDLLKQLAAPVLLIQGDQSPAFFAPIIEVLAGTLPNARRHLMPGAGHAPHMTHPDDYVSVVRDFLLERHP
jgi:pimeloyl-ACP methyl ester carboxylesterase